MKLLDATAAFCIICLILGLASYFMWKAYKAYTSPPQWRVEPLEREDRTELWLVQGKHSEFVGRTTLRKDPGYTDSLSELQAEAEERCASWNTAKKVAR